VAASGRSGAAGVRAGVAGAARAGASAAADGIQSIFKSSTAQVDATPNGPEGGDDAPEWAQQLQRRERIARGVSTAVQTVRSADHGGSGASPSLTEEK
jgi:type IV secretion system protein TrbL